ncbi:hypothetical protein IEO21_08359 [Rhodonia placenta]|uniref:Uncharacterized protein n=1 Tax=Rhodonia placenta TaxID=104341 RepID=A0A8H7NWU8_9APHY|nr:hypothetical protein IEO21_08359 [Postia placenta]
MDQVYSQCRDAQQVPMSPSHHFSGELRDKYCKPWEGWSGGSTAEYKQHFVTQWFPEMDIPFHHPDMDHWCVPAKSEPLLHVSEPSLRARSSL